MTNVLWNRNFTDIWNGNGGYTLVVSFCLKDNVVDFKKKRPIM